MRIRHEWIYWQIGEGRNRVCEIKRQGNKFAYSIRTIFELNNFVNVS